MIILNRPQTNPFFNLAAEEFLVKNTTEPLFMLWQNEASVVIGKHQNALKEINLRYVNENNIPVIRRISGGGTVFHDLGNLNYSFIDFGVRDRLVNFKKYSQPIIDVLQTLGVPAELVGKSDLKIKGLKFSGNASHVYKNTVLHHGTLLFHSELDKLGTSIKANTNPYSDKAVASNRSSVTNIQDHLSQDLSLNDFRNLIFDHIKRIYPETLIREFTSYEIEGIQKLVDEKYESWEWNYGYSPRYCYQGQVTTATLNLSFEIVVKNGLIESLIPNSESQIFNELIQKSIVGKNHNPPTIESLYQSNKAFFLKYGVDKSALLTAFFG